MHLLPRRSRCTSEPDLINLFREQCCYRRADWFARSHTQAPPSGRTRITDRSHGPLKMCRGRTFRKGTRPGDFPLGGDKRGIKQSERPGAVSVVFKRPELIVWGIVRRRAGRPVSDDRDQCARTHVHVCTCMRTGRSTGPARCSTK